MCERDARQNTPCGYVFRLMRGLVVLPERLPVPWWFYTRPVRWYAEDALYCIPEPAVLITLVYRKR